MIQVSHVDRVESDIIQINYEEEQLEQEAKKNR
jgi:hypothetical protein